MSDSPRRRQTTDETRRILLEAGHGILIERGYRAHIDIRLADAVKRAGYTTGAAYPIWPNQDAYRKDLARFIASETEWASVHTIVEAVGEVLERDPSFEEMVREAGNLYMQAFLGREEFYTLLYFHTVRDPDPELSASLAEGYDGIHADMCELFEGLLAIYNREMKPPFVIDDLGLAASVLAEGMALRRRIQPSVVDRMIGDPDRPWHPFSAALVAVGLHYSQHIGSDPGPADR